MEPPLTWSIAVTSSGERYYEYAANSAELDALAGYTGVDKVEALSSNVTVSPLPRARFSVSGTIKAKVLQLSVVSLEPVAGEIAENFAVEYWPREQIEAASTAEGDPPEADELIEGRIPIGILISELLSVSLDPYPRLEGESFEEPAQDLAAQGPFANLTRINLKDG